ncbi:hypothetical protein QPK32_04120 [Massilia sp. YIM B02763]|uniref:hypothetical protein n=1 Tax=Massilia sp. YIM B02763 TaxID=3050130 RepID=UPI0025B6BF65|nr:hypothetical protein [Massilia sp. YIM B02763]MDN4052251.1 hypothetical protein [Massilia sp. YIM B02763]
MTDLKCIETNESLSFYLPYELNAGFKVLFKTARWNSSIKAYEAKNTTQNKNKWKLFLEHAGEAKSALKAYDVLEPSMSEIEKLCEELKVCTKEATSKLQRAREQIALLTPEHERLVAQYSKVANELKDVEIQREKLIAPVLDLYRKHGFDAIMLEYQSGARRGYAGKDKCSAAEEKLRLLRKELKLSGFVVKGMSELLETSLNRADQLLERSERLAKNKLTGIEPYIEKTSNL